MFVLLVRFTVKPGAEEQAKKFMRLLEENTRREPGCQVYIGSQSNEDPRRFCFYEQYVDEKALESHHAAPYFAQYVVNGLRPLMETTHRETFTTVSQ